MTSSDIKAEKSITNVIIENGDIVHLNDFIYLAPEHLGEAYYIGRVMEFCTSAKRRGLLARIAWFNRPKDVINRKTTDPRLLVATMHSDINPVSSIRGKCTVTHKHYLNETVEQYRKKPDHFYYNQLYDRYIQRVYDVIPCETIQNLPEDILKALSQSYQYVVVEQGSSVNLTSARRICCVCLQWCPYNCYVTCSACQKNYHLSCVNPPLTKRPSKGFAWQCAFCTRNVILGEDNNASSSSTGATAAAAAAPAPARSANTIIGDVSKETIIKHDRQRTTRSQAPKPKVAERKEKSIKLKVTPKPTAEASSSRSKRPKGEVMTEMWPFRYYGVNSDSQRILDNNDQIYPRAQSRIGPKYQATVEEVSPEEGVTPMTESSSRSTEEVAIPYYSERGRLHELNREVEELEDSLLGKREDPFMASPPSIMPKLNKRFDRKGKGVERPKQESPVESSQDFARSMIPVRGTDETITHIFSQPEYLEEDELDSYMEAVKNIPDLPISSASSDLMDRALIELELNNYNTEIALDHMTRLNKDDFKHAVEWSREEIDAFEQSIREHGHDLNSAKRAVGTKTMADVVRFFYEWKKTDRYEQVYSEWTKIFKPTKNFKKSSQREGSVNDSDGMEESPDSGGESDPTVIPANGKKQYQCMNCQTNDSFRWRRPPSDTDRKRKQFKQVLCEECGVYWLKYSVKRPVGSGGSKPKRQLEDFEAPSIKRKKSNEGSTKPIPPKRQKESISHQPAKCKICSEIEPEDLVYTCQACGMSVHCDCYGVKKGAETLGWRCNPCENKLNPTISHDYECIVCRKTSKDPQQPLKRTTGYKWVHIQCALLIPEIKFVDANTFSPVEYIGCIDRSRLGKTCSICKSDEGVCIDCGTCQKPVHVQCAIDNNYKLGFQKQQDLEIPHVWCPGHTISNDITSLSERRDNQSYSLLYAKQYKQVDKHTTPAMRRYQPYSHPPPKERKQTRKTKVCSTQGCKVTHSPLWFDDVCLWCHNNNTPNKKVNKV
ncbi:BAH-domain-containing protein [Backusella circina FSU 941]|nr:BAH-domain-containing protein [Backusella circina FSU 941]